MPSDTAQAPYDESFFKGQQDGSVRSAQVVVGVTALSYRSQF
jgi:hypothetical protein